MIVIILSAYDTAWHTVSIRDNDDYLGKIMKKKEKKKSKKNSNVFFHEKESTA